MYLERKNKMLRRIEMYARNKKKMQQLVQSQGVRVQIKK